MLVFDPGDQAAFHAGGILEIKRRAMFDFSCKRPKQPESIDETDRQALCDTDWIDCRIWDIATVASFFNIANRKSAATDMQPNDEYHAMSR
jgi:hypothetical protein